MSKTWDAEWIWIAPREKMDNLTVHARKVVTLPEPPKSGTVYVTAGSMYKLYVNGHYVGRGPNPADPSYYYYDVYNVSEFLKPGENVLAVTAYNYGPNNDSITHQNYGPGGILLELRDQPDGALLAATDGSWKITKAPEYDQDAELNNTLFGDYKEICDTRLIPAGWKDAGFNDGSWEQPRVLGKPPLAPYTRLLEREIPALGGPRHMPEHVYWESAGVAYAWREGWEFYHEQGLASATPDVKPMQAFKTHADFSPSVLLDFGTLVTGYPEISVESSGGGVIDVLYGESLNLTREDRFILNGQKQVLQPFNRRTFRYMKLLFPETPDKIFIDRVSCDLNTYPVEYKGTFHSSDAKLDRMFDVAGRTIHLSMLDHFVDCPRRERTIYGGDLYNENLNAAYAFGDHLLNRKTLRQLFAIQFKEGAVPPLGPYAGFKSFYPSWTAYTGLALLDDYRLSGDREFLEECWPNYQRVLDWTIDQIEHATPHLIGVPETGGDIAAWSTHGKKKKFPAWGNLPFFEMLKRTVAVAEAIGKTKDAERCKRAAKLMGEAIRDNMIGPDGLFQTVPPGMKSDQTPMHDNVLLVWSGAVEGEAADRILDAAVSGKLGVEATPFHGQFTADALFSQGRAQDALNYLHFIWGDMLDRGATTFWEHYRSDMLPGALPSRGQSFCHGWSAGPAYVLPAFVLGVRPLTPGYEKVLVAPQTGNLIWAEGTVPTVHGDVHVRWDKTGGKLTVKVKSPRPVRVDLADGSHELPAGEHEVTGQAGAS